MITRLHIRDALTDGFNDTSAFMSEDNGERALRIFARERIPIWRVLISSSSNIEITDRCQKTSDPERPRRREGTRTCMADAGVVYLNTHFVGLGRRDLDVLEAQVFAGLPGHGRLAGDCLYRGWLTSLHFFRSSLLSSPISKLRRPHATGWVEAGSSGQLVESTRTVPFQPSKAFCFVSSYYCTDDFHERRGCSVMKSSKPQAAVQGGKSYVSTKEFKNKVQLPQT